MLNKCRCNGITRPYNMCISVTSTAQANEHFDYIGEGVIVEVDGRPYNGKEKYRFYREKRRPVHTGGRRSYGKK